jgi:hypothetical protein
MATVYEWFGLKITRTVFTGSASKLVVTVSDGLASKHAVTISSGLPSKLAATVSGGLASKSAVIVSDGLASKFAATVSGGLTLKSAATVSADFASKPVVTVFRFEPQNRQLWFDDLGLKITAVVSWFGIQNQADFSLSVAPQNRREGDGVGHTSRSSDLLHVIASRARIFQSGLKTGGCATVGGACDTIVEVASG